MRARVRRYSLREVAKALGLHVETVRRAIRAGRLTSARSPSGHYCTTTLAEVTEWLRRYPPRRSPSPPNPTTSPAPPELEPPEPPDGKA